MRIVIIGAGGIGGWLGTRLSASGQQVGFLVHDRTLAALRSGGLTLRDCSGGEPGTVERCGGAVGDGHVCRPFVSGAALVHAAVVCSVGAPSSGAPAEES